LRLLDLHLLLALLAGLLALSALLASLAAALMIFLSLGPISPAAVLRLGRERRQSRRRNQ
jgi:Flp pilus assembly protein TadB